MDPRLRELLDRQGGVVTSAQVLGVITRRKFEAELKTGPLQKIWYGIYADPDIDADPGADPDADNRGPSDELLLRGLDLAAGTTVAMCLGTAAAAYGFDTEEPVDLHVLNPPDHQLRSADGLVVHRREGAPLSEVGGRPATAPEWTAIEVARALRRPRALATLDAALRSGTCSRAGLYRAAARQAGRRGIVAVRDLLPLADPLAESAMESESRLMMIDGGLPRPVLQYEVRDRSFRLWRLDFAWPELRVAVEYDGLFWHEGPESFAYERQRRAALQEMGWLVIPIIADDVRRRPWQTVRRIETHLARAAA